MNLPLDVAETLLEDRAEGGIARQPETPDVLDRQLDRRQGVLDLMRDPPRHFGPGREPSRAHDLGDVLQENNRARWSPLLGGEGNEDRAQPPLRVTGSQDDFGLLLGPLPERAPQRFEERGKSGVSSQSLREVL